MTDYPLTEQKLVYRVLHKELARFPDLMDTQFLEDLQTALQKQAQAEDVDVSDHGAWDSWLGNTAVSCDVRNRKRSVIG